MIFNKKKTKVLGKKEKEMLVDINIHLTSEEDDPDIGKWEIIKKNTSRWYDYGFSNNNHPGYGKIFEREFEVWCSDIGKKNKIYIQQLIDRSAFYREPIGYKKVAGANVFLETLTNTKGYYSLFSGLDSENRQRWYFGLKKATPLWIRTVKI